MQGFEGREEIKVVIFHVGQRLFAIPIEYVREILPYQDPISVPDSPDWLAGVIDLAGRVLPVVSLHERFDESMDEDERHLIRLQFDDQRGAAFTTDAVTAIRVLEDEAIRDVDQLSGEMQTPLLWGAARVDNQLVLVINPEKVVDVDYIHSFAKMCE